MKFRNALVVFSILVCSAGVAIGQTEWVDHPDNPLIGPGDQGSWDAAGHYLPSVVFDGTTYHMWFTGIDEDDVLNHVGHATSADGVEWTLDSSNPVLSPGPSGEWDGVEVWSGPVTFDGSQFHMWYSGWDGENERVGHATSPDGTVWTRDSRNPVVDVGSSGSWDAWVVRAGAVITDGTTVRMWYTGLQNDATAALGYAESSDGIHWTKRPDPVFEPGNSMGGGWDTPLIYHPEVVFDGSMYHMWYVGGDWMTSFLGCAFSTDGIEWTKHRYNPVFQTSGDSIESTSVIVDEPGWRMWYGYHDASADWVSYATSDCCACAAALDDLMFVPAAAVAAGAQGAFFQTDVDMSNADDQAIDYEFQWLPRGENNSEPATSETFSLGAGKSVRYANVLTEVFDLEPDSLGALLIWSTSPDLLAMSRTYNAPSAKVTGTYGQSIPGVGTADFIQYGEKRRILFVSENADLRTNIGCQNGSDSNTVVYLDLFDAGGTPLGREIMMLKPIGNEQANRIFEDHQPTIGYVDISVAQAGNLAYCFGSVLDNVTSDPTTIPPQ